MTSRKTRANQFELSDSEKNIETFQNHIKHATDRLWELEITQAELFRDNESQFRADCKDGLALMLVQKNRLQYLSGRLLECQNDLAMVKREFIETKKQAKKIGLFRAKVPPFAQSSRVVLYFDPVASRSPHHVWMFHWNELICDWLLAARQPLNVIIDDLSKVRKPLSLEVRRTYGKRIVESDVVISALRAEIVRDLCNLDHAEIQFRISAGAGHYISYPD